MESIGDQLLEVLRGGATEVFLAAPFIKVDVLRRLLDEMNPGTPTTVVTRWRPNEVAAGVSDLETFDLLTSRPCANLRLCHPLHAKYYRVGSQVFIGSANLTRAALGWSRSGNLEILIEATSLLRDWKAFEREILDASVPATRKMRDLIASAAGALTALGTFVELQIDEEPSGDTRTESSRQGHKNCEWLPNMRQPGQLLRLYYGDRDNVTSEGMRQGLLDLAALDVPPGLNEEQFAGYVRAVLSQLPLVVEIDALAQVPQRFGAIRDRIREHLKKTESARDANEVWQTLMRWLLYYFPRSYMVLRPKHSEIFFRVAKQ